MNITDYRQSHPGCETRAKFVSWLNERMPDGVSISISYLRDLESGRAIPSLLLAVTIEESTGGVISVREWPGLVKRRHRPQ